MVKGLVVAMAIGITAAACGGSSSATLRPSRDPSGNADRSSANAIASTSAPQRAQVFVVGANGQNLRRLTSGHVAHRLLVWMPGGAAVADVASVGGLAKVWIESRRTSGAGQRDLSARVSRPWPKEVVVDQSFAFSPARSLTVLETCCGPSRHDLGIVGAPGTQPRLLDSWPTYYSGSSMAAWSPNGRLIAYARTTGPLSTQNALDRQSIAVIAPNGQRRRILTRAIASDNVEPLFSPDGKSILFCAYGAPEGLYTVPTQGGPVHRITDRDCHHDIPAWSPNGHEIADIGYGKSTLGNQTPQLFVIDVRTGHLKSLASSVQPATPAWSPDSKKIAFAGSAAVQTINVDGSDTRDIVRAARSQTIDLAWSRDKTQIAFTLGPPPANY